jgi:hypothetical protein
MTTCDRAIDRSLRASIAPLDWCVLADRLTERGEELAYGSDDDRQEFDRLTQDAATLRLMAELLPVVAPPVAARANGRRPGRTDVSFRNQRLRVRLISDRTIAVTAKTKSRSSRFDRSRRVAFIGITEASHLGLPDGDEIPWEQSQAIAAFFRALADVVGAGVKATPDNEAA